MLLLFICSSNFICPLNFINSFHLVWLERDATTNVYTWSDGTLYDLSINTPVTDQGATRYVILNGRFNDHPSPSVPFPYLCQANFDGITW